MQGLRLVRSWVPRSKREEDLSTLREAPEVIHLGELTGRLSPELSNGRGLTWKRLNDILKAEWNV